LGIYFENRNNTNSLFVVSSAFHKITQLLKSCITDLNALYFTRPYIIMATISKPLVGRCMGIAGWVYTLYYISLAGGIINKQWVFEEIDFVLFHLIYHKDSRISDVTLLD